MNRVEVFGALLEEWQRRGLDRRQFIRLVAVGTSAATLSAIIAACGGSSDKKTATSLPGAPTTAAGGTPGTSNTPTPLAQTVGSPAVNPLAVPTAAPFVDKTFLIALNEEPPTLDVHNSGSNAALGAFKLVYEGLVSLDEKMRVVNLLAESWEASDDAKTFTFKLHKGVKFHDGTPFNAQAVKDAWERVLAPDSKLTRHNFFGNVIDHWEAVDEGTLKLVAKLPFAAMIATFAHPAGGVPSPTALKKYGDDFGINPVGTGPFKFVEWVRGDHIAFEANPDYWNKAIGPAVSKLTVKGISEPSALGIAIQSGDAQFAGPIAAPQAEQLKGASGVVISETASITGYYVILNNTRKPFDDKRVRQALNYGVNKDEVLKAVDLGQGKPLDSPLAEGIYGYHSVKTYAYDAQKAKDLLAEANMADGFKTSLWTSAVDKDRAVAIQAQLKKIGVEADVVQMEDAALDAEYGKPVEESQKEMLMTGFSPSTGDADLELRLAYTKTGWPPVGFNASFYDNPEVDKYVQQGLELVDPDKRKEAYAKAQELIVEDAPNIFLYAPTYFGALRDNVGGVSTQADGVVYMRTAYFKQ